MGQNPNKAQGLVQFEALSDGPFDKSTKLLYYAKQAHFQQFRTTGPTPTLHATNRAAYILDPFYKHGPQAHKAAYMGMGCPQPATQTTLHLSSVFFQKKFWKIVIPTYKSQL